MSNQVTFTCSLCPDKAPPLTAELGSLLALLKICQRHQDERVARGVKAMRDADAGEVKNV